MRISEDVLRILADSPDTIYSLHTAGPGPAGKLPLTDEFLREAPSGDVFGWTQNVGMGWDPAKLTGDQVLILGTQGGLRRPDGSPVALGFHTGHWEIGLLMEEAAGELTNRGCIPFAGFCSDPCDGRTQGTPGMMDSLAYRNDAAAVLRRLIRSLPTRKAVLGAATCDKGLPAMMMALASMHDLPCLLMPGGVTLPATNAEDLGKVQSIGARYSHGEITLEYAQEMGCRACGSPGGGCQFFGNGGDQPGRGRSAWPCIAALRAFPLRTTRLERHGEALGSGRTPPGQTRNNHQGYPHALRGPQRHGCSRSLRWLHQSPASHTRRRLFSPTATARGSGLDRSEPESATARRRPAQRPRRTSNRPSVPRRRSPGGHAAPARTRSAGAGVRLPQSASPLGRCSNSGSRRKEGVGCAPFWLSGTESIRLMSSCRPTEPQSEA